MVQTDEWNAFQTPAAYQEPSAAAVSQQTEEETPQVDQDTETVVIFPEDSEDSENFLNKDK
jgi:cell division initiation protein